MLCCLGHLSSFFCSSLLAPPVATFCFEICASVVWLCQTLRTPPCQSRALRQHKASRLIQFYWRWQFQAWCLRDQRPAQLICLCLGACPLTSSADVLGSFNYVMWQWGKILRIKRSLIWGLPFPQNWSLGLSLKDLWISIIAALSVSFKLFFFFS